MEELVLQASDATGDVRSAALEYASRGWRVLPLHSVAGGVCSCGRPDCESPGKHPRTRNGSRGASNNPIVVADWWESWPDSNIGIATGKESGIVVVDVDGPTDLEFPESATVKTGRGYQIYYEATGDVSNSAKKLDDNVDVRGEGGYVVAPPSIHANGTQYAWVKQGRIIPAPDFLVSHAQPAEPTERPTGMIPSGQRNQVLASLAGVMRRSGMTGEEIYAALSQVNRDRCSPHLSESEVRTIARSIGRYNPEDPIHLAISDAPDIRVYTAEELRDLVLPDLDELVGPLLVRGNRLVVAGHTGEGKTTFALQLVHAAISGNKFLQWKGRGGCSVLVIDAEQGLRTIQRRVLEAGFDGVHPHFVRVPDGINLDNNAEANLVEEVIANGAYDIVVLDPLYKLHKGELTDERVSVDLMRRLDAWRERYKFGLVILAHCRKPPPGVPFTIHDVFGSTAVLRGAEVVLGLQRTAPGSSVLHFFKDRDGDLSVGEAWELHFNTERGFTAPLLEHDSWISRLTGKNGGE